MKTVLVLCIGIIAISFGSIFIKFCTDVPAIMIATYRMTGASLILLAYCRIRHKKIIPADPALLYYGIAGGLFLALHFITWITSLKYTSVASSVVLVDTDPIFVVILSWFFLREKQSVALIAGIVLSLAGSIMLAIADSNLFTVLAFNKNALIGDALALTGGLMGSCYLIIGGKMREKLDIINYITIVYTAAAVFLITISLVLRLPFTGYKQSSYFYMILLALIPQLLGHSSFNWALKHLKTSMVAITILGEPIGASFLAYLIFHEQIKGLQLAGILLIFTAIIIASLRGKK